MGPEQLGDLVDRYAAALTLYARQWCACPEDVVQTAFLKLVRLRTAPENLVPWLYRVVRTADGRAVVAPALLAAPATGAERIVRVDPARQPLALDAFAREVRARLEARP